MKIGIFVGHSRQIKGKRDGGAVSVDGTSEWQYNQELASILEDDLRDLGHKTFVWDHYEGGTYSTAMMWVAKQAKAWGADLAIELHFNAASPNANGHEWLYWHTSDAGFLLCKTLERGFKTHFPELVSRGVKARNMQHRGAQFLRRTHCPAIIAEPFFGTSESDWQVAIEQREIIAQEIANAIDIWALHYK